MSDRENGDTKKEAIDLPDRVNDALGVRFMDDIISNRSQLIDDALDFGFSLGKQSFQSRDYCSP